MSVTPIALGEAGSKKRLFEIGLKALEENGYTIERVPSIGKSSIRRIKKDGQSKIVSIKTTQDTWIAFQRNDTSWITLPDVDAVVAVEHPAGNAVLRGDAIHERTKPDALHHAGDADANRVHPGPT